MKHKKRFLLCSRCFLLYKFRTVYATMGGFFWFDKETAIWLASEITLALNAPIILAI